jgi:hypothetical protein
LTEQEQDIYERGYREGKRSAMLSVLRTAMSALGVADVRDRAVMVTTEMTVERQEAIAALREVCGEFGDDEWPDDLSLADVIKKHLANHLHDRREE